MNSNEIQIRKQQELSIIDKPVSRAVSMSRHMLKFFEYNDDLMQQTQQRLLAITYNLGITEPPPAAQLNVLVEFLKNNFPESNMEEIAYAAELYCIGNLQDCPKHYNQMTMDFLGKLMKAYRNYRADEIKRVEVIERKRLLAEKEYERKQSQPKTPEELHQIWLDFEKESWEKICQTVRKNKMIPLGWRWDEAYAYLMASGQVTETNAELEQLKIKWEKDFKVDVAMQRTDAQKMAVGLGLKSQLDEINQQLSDPKSIKQFCRKKYVIQKLQTIIDEK